MSKAIDGSSLCPSLRTLRLSGVLVANMLNAEDAEEAQRVEMRRSGVGMLEKNCGGEY